MQDGGTQREHWASRFGFLMATAGYSIGLGNIWRFPYLVGSNGGGAFLLVYLIFAFVIGIPLLTAEIGLGRKAGLTPLAGMAKVRGSARSPWNAVAWLGVATALLVQSYYVIVIGWILGYLLLIASGRLAAVEPQDLDTYFAEFTAAPGPIWLLTLLIVFALGLIVSRGLRGGLERVASVAMPLLLVLLVALAGRSLTFEGALSGLTWYLTPDFSAIDGSVLLAALGQAFYSIGIGMAVAFGFGSYLGRKSDVPGNAAIVVCCATAIALLAGLVIFPALFAFALEPDAGPGLLFVTMTRLFDAMPAGSVFGACFFFLLLLAAITSAAAVHEVLTMTLVDLLRFSRRRATWICAGLFMTLATPILLSQGPWTSARLFDMDLFTLADTATGTFLLPLGALVLAVYVARVWGFDAFRDEVNDGAGRFRVSAAWRPVVVWLIPLAVLVVMLTGFGVF